jgi:hypothetical protein
MDDFGHRQAFVVGRRVVVLQHDRVWVHPAPGHCGAEIHAAIGAGGIERIGNNANGNALAGDPVLLLGQLTTHRDTDVLVRCRRSLRGGM